MFDTDRVIADILCRDGVAEIDADTDSATGFGYGTLSRAGRAGCWGLGLTARALLLLIAGVLWAIPAFFRPHQTFG